LLTLQTLIYRCLRDTLDYMTYMKKLIAATLILFAASTTVTFATEPAAPNAEGSNSDTVTISTPNTGGSNADTVAGDIPTTGGSNANDAAGGIPTTGGSNTNDANGIIPNVGGSNANDADASIIPTMGGSNSDDTAIVEAIIVASTTPPADAQIPASGGSNGSDSARSGGSTSSGGSIPVTFSRLITEPVVPTAGDIGSCTYLNDYLSLAGSNNPVEVTKLQQFLNTYEGFNLAITGVYDEATFNAVKAFQAKYINETMAPWGWKVGSGIVSFTTKKKINEIYCKSNFNLDPELLARIQAYKIRLLTPPAAPKPAPLPVEIEEGTTTPENPGIEVGFNIPALNSAPLGPLNDTNPVENQGNNPRTQTASVSDASSGLLDGILDIFNKIF
jgi:hypothetical protein